jgi:antitoxin MazE
MKTRVKRWGNSLAVRIPRDLAQKVGLKVGDEVEIMVEGGYIVIKPLHSQRFTLEELLAGVTEDKLHGEFDTGPDVGKEIVEW